MMTTGTPEELALSGLIGETFDRADLQFDPATGVFVLAPERHAEARSARVCAPPALRPVVERMLGRHGYALPQQGPVDLEIRYAADGGAQLRCNGTTDAVADLGVLTVVARDLKTDSALQVSDSSEVVAGLHRIAALTPYFAVSTGAIDEQSWQPVRTLYDDTAALAAVVDGVAARIAAPERRVAVSIFFQGYAARLWSIALGMLVREDKAIELDASELSLARDGRDGDAAPRAAHRAAGSGGARSPPAPGHRGAPGAVARRRAPARAPLGSSVVGQCCLSSAGCGPHSGWSSGRPRGRTR